MIMLTDLNHLTLAVNDVKKSFHFYVEVLGFKPLALWDHGAYLQLNTLWLCLSEDTRNITEISDYTHYAFSLSANNFETFKQHLLSHGITSWKENKSEGDSFYFYDPDNHKLEIHVGDLESRLKTCRQHPYSEMQFFDNK